MTGLTLFSPSAGVGRTTAAEAGAHVPPEEKAKLKSKANEFEAYFVQQFIDLSAPDASDNPLTGGGETESFFTQKMHEQIAKSVVDRGGIGLSQNVYTQLLKMQEAKHAALPNQGERP